MSGGEALVMMIFCLSTCLTIFGIWYLRNRENMALIDKGFNPRKDHLSLPRPYGNLKYGLLLLGAGLGLTLAFLLDNNIAHKTMVRLDGSTYQREFETLYFSLIAVGGGLGLVVSYFIERNAWERFSARNDRSEPAS